MMRRQISFQMNRGSTQNSEALEEAINKDPSENKLTDRSMFDKNFRPILEYPRLCFEDDVCWDG